MHHMDGGTDSMPEIHGTSSVPDDPRYWDALATRVTAAAVRPRAGEWLGSSRALLVAVGTAALAASLLWVLAPLTNASRVPNDAWAMALSPGDRVGRSMSSRAAPPPLAELLLIGANTVDGGK